MYLVLRTKKEALCLEDTRVGVGKDALQFCMKTSALPQQAKGEKGRTLVFTDGGSCLVLLWQSPWARVAAPMLSRAGWWEQAGS